MNNMSQAGRIVIYASIGQLENVRDLLESGINPDQKYDYSGYTALIAASEKGYIDIVRLLIDYKASVNERGLHGCTALERACAGGYYKIVQLLIDNGAEVDARNGAGWTALISATLNGHLESVHLLLKAGASLDIRDEEGRTAIDWAERNDCKETRQALKDAAKMRAAFQKAISPALQRNLPIQKPLHFKPKQV